MTLRLAMWSAFAFALLCLPAGAGASSFEITFEEGAFTYDPNKPASALENKYLARVTVKKDGAVSVGGLRGSTLPDAPLFYQIWHVEKKNPWSMSDANVAAVFKMYEEIKDAASSGSDLAKSIVGIADIVSFLNAVPVAWSGRYPFAIGLHKDGKGVHGRPYVPRLLGGPRNAPYDGRSGNGATNAPERFVMTINRNKAWQMNRVASGINIHDGRISKDYRDSEGCLTIQPDHWEKLYKALPGPDDWAKGGHTGVVVVIRPK